MGPFWSAFASRRGTCISRPCTRTVWSVVGSAFHWDRRERVLLRDILRFGTAICPAAPFVVGTIAVVYRATPRRALTNARRPRASVRLPAAPGGHNGEHHGCPHPRPRRDHDDRAGDPPLPLHHLAAAGRRGGRRPRARRRGPAHLPGRPAPLLRLRRARSRGQPRRALLRRRRARRHRRHAHAGGAARQRAGGRRRRRRPLLRRGQARHRRARAGLLRRRPLGAGRGAGGGPAGEPPPRGGPAPCRRRAGGGRAAVPGLRRRRRHLRRARHPHPGDERRRRPRLRRRQPHRRPGDDPSRWLTRRGAPRMSRELPHRRRAWLLGVVVPAVITALAWTVVLALAPRLPDPVALHWGPSGVDGTGSLTALLVPMAVLSGLSLVVMAIVSLRVGRQAMTRRLVLGLAVGLATLFAGITVVSVVVQVDAPSAAAATSPDAWIAATIVLAGLLGTAAAALAGADPARPATGPVPADAAAARLPEGGRTVWARHATVSRTGRAVSRAGAVLLVGLAVLLGVASGSWWLAVVLLLPLPTILLFLSWRVRVDAAGLTVRARLGRPRQHVPAAEVLRADVVDVDPFGEFGGWGLRISPGLDGTVGVVLRRGEAIAVERTAGRRFVVTVDDAATGAALLNTYAQRAREGSPRRPH